MSKLTSLIRRAPKRFTTAVAIIAAAIIVPAAVFAWGPTRETFTVEQPAPYVTFNSITNNPNYGDERNFVTIKDAANTNAGGWTDELTAENGKEYYVRMYVHNNAAENLNLVAENVTAKFNVPTYEADRIQIDGYLSSSNAKPGEVWDQAVFKNTSKFKLDYVEGSAEFTNNVFTSGTALGDSVVGSGAKLGYDKLDGKIPGCFKYDGVVTFKVKVQSNDFDVQKTVRVNGATDKTFKESVAVKPGDKVDYQIYFKNTGSTQLKDVVIKDTLPQGVTYVPGTTYLHNSGGTRLVADGVTAGGMVIGGYLPGASAYIKFTAQVAANDKLPKCGPNTLKNIAKATTTSGSKEDHANVTVTKECEEEPKEIVVCELATKKPLTIKESEFDASKHSKDFDDCKEEVKYIKVCDLATKKPVTIKEADFDTSKHSEDWADCEEVVKDITVCDLKTKEIVSIHEKDFDSTKHSKTLADCEEDDIPEVLPETGITENIVAILGLGALVASAAYYIASRRALV